MQPSLYLLLYLYLVLALYFFWFWVREQIRALHFAFFNPLSDSARRPEDVNPHRSAPHHLSIPVWVGLSVPQYVYVVAV
jgi:hypothetical protein